MYIKKTLFDSIKFLTAYEPNKNLAQLRISGNRILWVWQLNDPGLNFYDYIQDSRMFLLATDAWFLNNLDQPLEDADVILLDAKDYGLKLLVKVNMSIARKLSKYQEDALPIRITHVHVVNTPPIIDKLFGIAKTFLSKKITDMMHFHTPNSDTIYKFLGKEDLPEDFGGTLGKMEDHMKKFTEVVLKHRDQLTNESLWRATGEKKSKSKKESHVEIPFRSLAID